MPDAVTPPCQTAVEEGRAWRGLMTMAGIVAVEAMLAGWWFGPWLRTIPGKRWIGLALLGGGAALWAHIDGHRREYAALRLVRPVVGGQLAAFVVACAVLSWVAADPRLQGSPVLLPLILAVAMVPAVAALATIAPSRSRARQLLGSTAVAAAFVVAAWAVGDLTDSFWAVSGDATMWLVKRLLTPLAGEPVIRPEPFVIGTQAFQVRIAPACSGFHGIGLVTALLVGVLWWFRGMYRFPQALVLVPLGAILMWLVNVVRIVALILVGIWISPAIAVDGFHSVAGWIGFLTVGLGIVWTASRSAFFTVPAGAAAARTPAEPAAGGVPGSSSAGAGRDASVPATTCLLPFLVLTGVTMLTRAFTSGFDLLYPLRVVAVGAVLWTLKDTLPRGTWQWRDWRATALPVVIGVVTFALWMLLAPATAGPAEAVAAGDPFAMTQPWASLWLLFRVAGSTITVPIAEELFFRGFLSRRCISEDVDRVPLGQFSWFSCAVSSVAFGLLHGEAWLAGTVAGLLFTAALSWRRRLSDAVVAHATTNALLSGYVIATGSWSAWG